jgi:hypothetical protein
LNRRPTGYEPVALSQTKLRARRRGSDRNGGRRRRRAEFRDRNGGPSGAFEPLTFRLTADRSTAELRRHRGRRAGPRLIAFPSRGEPLVLVRAVLEVLDELAHLVERVIERRPELLGLVRDDGSVGGGLYHPLPLQEVQ